MLLSNIKKIPKTKLFIDTFLDREGKSIAIKRYELDSPLAYTSGDGIFRSDGQLGKKYKFFRFSKTLDFRKKSRCWEFIPSDKEMLTRIHSNLIFYKSGNIVEYIQFFGLSNNPIIDQGIHPNITKIITKLPCVNCATSKDIECDHKNDLKNDPRVLYRDTQTIDDFQPLCKHCNDVKRAVKSKMENTNRRIGATTLGFTIDFTEGDFTLDKKDPNWYKGTYWGDCLDFKKKLSLTYCL